MQSVLYVFTSLILFALTANAGGGFSASCNNYYLDGNTLRANCGNGHGGSQNTAIDLNRCITNNNGNLVCAENGGFGGSCSDCVIHTGTYMRCYCGPGPNNTPVADLNQCVANYGGNLACAK